ncbi:hypothetical protein BLNAU_21438 [Blattamonas nauphoetae]|uniref:Uncharacterized protein n=1 Tax=Blattamonas nauphoetae TaxID=2049346 RepID=A0ABQ9WWF3_9EUKA|nr:hypothetical protein BLNAU_21438 [Blattamonas nauphoetae]
MEAERETTRKAEEERQREFVRKMGEMEELKKMHAELIEEGRQRREEQKREAERKRIEEEERRRNVKEGAAAIEVFARDSITLSGNVFTKLVHDWSSLFSNSFGPVIVRITFVVRDFARNVFLFVVIAADLVEQVSPTNSFFSNLKRAASWVPLSSWIHTRHHGKEFHSGSACKAVADGQRVVMEADGREGKRTLKLSQDGQAQPTFFSTIPVPFRFVTRLNGASVEIISTEVLRDAEMGGGIAVTNPDIILKLYSTWKCGGKIADAPERKFLRIESCGGIE